MAWHTVGNVADFSEDGVSEVIVEGEIIAVAKVDGRFHAMGGICPHQGGPLGTGELEGCILRCPWHGLQFDVRTGETELKPPMKNQRFETKVKDDLLMIEIAR